MFSSDITPIRENTRVEILQRYADNPSAFLALNQDNAVFTVPGLTGFICYRPWGRFLIQFGGPFAPRNRRAELLRRFLDHAADRRKRVVAVQLQRADAELYADLGLPVNQIGASYAVALDQVELAGRRFVRLRNKISRARRAGLVIEETDPDGHRATLAEIDRCWLRSKGRQARPLRFLVGEIGGPAQHLRKLFLGTVAGRPVGYISYSPVFGAYRGWLHDLSRRVPDAAPGVMEAINLTAMRRLSRGDTDWLHFGFTPFTGLDSAVELPTASRATARVVRLLADHGERLYPSRTQLEYKMKWQPTLVFPEYLAIDGRLSPGALWSLLRVTNAL
ncbi:DUF2156 domain-containing protein [Nocardia transvalensis]|uniref:bifunctional lysylphosphatidylglycerol flippase/synthetase MprF n=1 Tax=Nocardia transvalensis TaxID=37333 RepID=UPI002B4B529C|nr:DUF2156 domain-containing protein [Nocardia transvalensis]